MKRWCALAIGLALLAASPLQASAAQVDKSDNVKLVAHFPYSNESGGFFDGGTDIDFSGKYVYAMQQGANGGVHVIDASGPTPKKLAFITCPGEQNDVAVVKPGLIAIGYHSSTCAGALGGGITLVDVSDPKRPKFLSSLPIPTGGTHTLTVYPGKPIIYSSPNGLGNVRGKETIVDVSNPKKPEIAATYDNTPSACHDLTFHFSKDKKLAFCPGSTQTEIWDVADPLKPVTIARIFNPLMFYHHSAAVTHDGKLLVIGDEAEANDCRGGPTGAMFAYDITDPTLPVPQGYFGINRGSAPIGSPTVDRGAWCTAHIFNFVPGTYTMVAAWYASGMNVIDWSNPSAPAETAHYMGLDVITNYWSAYWYDGRIYANDRVRGLDVFEVKGLAEKR
jgi:hypothetical protein